MTAIGKALVIGAGIAGPATAMALQKTGVEATIYEAYPEPADGIGAFLTVASNGLHALEALGCGLPADAAFATPSLMLRSWRGKRLGTVRTGLAPGEGPPSRTIKRADLYRALRDAAAGRGTEILYGKRLVSAIESSDGVRATFADGTEAFGDVLVGCDGVHSQVRRMIDSSAPAPDYVGLLNTGGYARGVAVDLEAGGYEMIFGKRAFFGYALAPGGEVWWFANIPRRTEPSVSELAALRGERLRQTLLDLVAGDAGPAVDLVEATADLLPVGPIHYIPRLPRWRSERMVLVGDAAHAPTPSSGQGASLAFEDAVVLASCLRDASDPAAALAQLEALRRPRVEGIIKWASRVNSSKAAGRAGSLVRDALMPAILRLTANTNSVRDIYRYRVQLTTSG